MKTFEYQIVNISSEIKAVRASQYPRFSDGDQVLVLEIVNRLGSEGWRWLTPDETQAAYFERESNA